MQWGERYESHYARYGKLMGITLGDGALVNGFFDQGVDLRSSRPGFEVMVDLSPYTPAAGGVHFVTNDLFDPTLVAWRFFVRPLSNVPKAIDLSKLEIGLSWAYSPPKSDETQLHRHQFFAIDTSSHLPVSTSTSTSSATSSPRRLTALSSAPRWGGDGASGDTKSILVFNASLTNTIRGNSTVHTSPRPSRTEVQKRRKRCCFLSAQPVLTPP